MWRKISWPHFFCSLEETGWGASIHIFALGPHIAKSSSQEVEHRKARQELQNTTRSYLTTHIEVTLRDRGDTGNPYSLSSAGGRRGLLDWRPGGGHTVDWILKPKTELAIGWTLEAMEAVAQLKGNLETATQQKGS